MVEKLQAGKAGAEVIDRDLISEVLISVKHGFRVVGILKFMSLRHLEADEVLVQPIFSKRYRHAPVDIIEKRKGPVVKVEEEPDALIMVDAGKLFHGLFPEQEFDMRKHSFLKGAIEEILDAVEPCLFIISQKRFIAKAYAGMDIDDRLERIIDLFGS